MHVSENINSLETVFLNDGSSLPTNLSRPGTSPRDYSLCGVFFRRCGRAALAKISKIKRRLAGKDSCFCWMTLRLT